MSENNADGGSSPPWSRVDRLLMTAWGLVAVATRLPLVARAEGMLDHDQSVVGLMALDIAAGRRFPLFFDGQRYMGAVEPWVAAGFVRLLGHSPAVVALSPLLFFGLFVAGQFGLWRAWRGRASGNLAALLTVICGPMLTVWGIVPRGGYAAALAWALPTLWAYRELTRSDRQPIGPAAQFGWGFLFALGYFLNPLSLILYATIALDWTFDRHGPELRRARGATGRLALGAIGLAWLFMATCCLHVDPRAIATSGLPYVAFGGAFPGKLGVAVGGACVVALLGVGGWLTGAPARFWRLLAPLPWAVVGALLALSPFVVQGLLVKFGGSPDAPTLPVWLGAPWKAGPNLLTGIDALKTLVGSDPRPLETVLIGQGVEPPGSRWPILATALLAASPMVIATVGLLLTRAFWENRGDWVRSAAAPDGVPGGPESLCLLYLAVAVSLYLLQGTSPNASSARYLVPIWVVLPGLLAAGLTGLPGGWRFAGLAALLVPWAGVNVSVWADIDRPSPSRCLSAELERRGITAIIAPTPVALIVANLTSGRVGALEFRPPWPRIGPRYLYRFPENRPIVCVSDRKFPSFLNQGNVGVPDGDLARHLQELAARHPGRVNSLCSVDEFDIWEADLPLETVLGAKPGPPSWTPKTR